MKQIWSPTVQMYTHPEQHHHGNTISWAPCYLRLLHHLSQVVEGQLNGVDGQSGYQITSVCGYYYYGKEPETTNKNTSWMRPGQPYTTCKNKN